MYIYDDLSSGSQAQRSEPRLTLWPAQRSYYPVTTQVVGGLLENGLGQQATGLCVVSSGGSRIRCGSCEAREQRIRRAPLPRLVPVPAELRYSARLEELDAEALAAYQRMYQAARAAGIPGPYLKLISGYRAYDGQANLWSTKLLVVFRSLGCDATSRPCLAAAIQATNQSLRLLPAPHPRNTWANRFLQELRQANCSVPCDPLRAVQIARRGVAPPGGSPHHTGRAVDVFVGRAPGSNSPTSTVPEFVQWQRTQAPYRWLVCNASRFGFYPYNAEPWHWEYNPPA